MDGILIFDDCQSVGSMAEGCLQERGGGVAATIGRRVGGGGRCCWSENDSRICAEIENYSQVNDSIIIVSSIIDFDILSRLCIQEC